MIVTKIDSDEQYILTPSEITQLTQSYGDFNYFIDTFLMPVKHLINAQLAQALPIKNVNNIYISHAKEDTGIDITMAAYVLWYALFNAHKQIFIIDENLAKARIKTQLIRQLLSNIPSPISVGLKVNNKSYVQLENYSAISIASVNSLDRMRGHAISLIWSTRHSEEVDLYLSHMPPLNKLIFDFG